MTTKTEAAERKRTAETNNVYHRPPRLGLDVNISWANAPWADVGHRWPAHL